jgi:hypothetical protein
VFAVICNTDYIYEGEATRTAHFDYRLQLGTGVTGTASITSKWYKGPSIGAKSDNSSVSTFDISKFCSQGVEKLILAEKNNVDLEESIAGDIYMYPNPLNVNGILHVKLDETNNENSTIQISNILGKVVFSEVTCENDIEINTMDLLKSGLYIVTIKNTKNSKTFKLLVE